MNKRQRKKWLKKHNKYINPKDTWDLDATLGEYIAPRLKLLKKTTHGYPGTLSSIEEWKEILDKMIFAFEFVQDYDKWWINNPEYDYIGYPDKCDFTKHREQELLLYARVQEGLNLFAKYYMGLWD